MLGRPLLGWSPPRHSLGYFKHVLMLGALSSNSPSFIVVVPRKIAAAKSCAVTLLVEPVLSRDFNCRYVIMLLRHKICRYVRLARLVEFVVFKEIIATLKHRLDLGAEFANQIDEALLVLGPRATTSNCYCHR